MNFERATSCAWLLEQSLASESGRHERMRAVLFWITAAVFRRLLEQPFAPRRVVMKSHLVVGAVVLHSLRPIGDYVLTGAFLALAEIAVAHRWMFVKLIQRFRHAAFEAGFHLG